MDLVVEQLVVIGVDQRTKRLILLVLVVATGEMVEIHISMEEA